MLMKTVASTATLVLALSIVGCGAFPIGSIGGAAKSATIEHVIERYAHPKVQDWSTGLVSSPSIAAMRRARPFGGSGKAAAAEAIASLLPSSGNRHVLTSKNSTYLPSGEKISSAPARLIDEQGQRCSRTA